MNKRTIRIKQETICWRQFSRQSDAIFRSLGREISIGVLSVATLLVAAPDSSAARLAMTDKNDDTAMQAATDDDADNLQTFSTDLLQEGDLIFTVTRMDENQASKESKNRTKGKDKIHDGNIPKDNGIASVRPDGNMSKSKETSPLSHAIADVTEGIDRQNITHVAIVHKSQGKWFALEANGKHGVWLNPMDDFIASTDKTPDNLPMIIVARLRDRSNINTSVKRALSYIGRPYDDLYMPSDTAIYCSELVQLSYLNADGSHVFPLIPMSFHDSTGQVTPFWTAYYEKRGLSVPEGEPGTNPGGLSCSPALEIIYNYARTPLSPTLYTSINLPLAEVTASRIPIPADKAARLVQVLNRKDIEGSAAQSVNDLLKLVAGVDVRQRGGFGVQTDIGINGGNEDQLTVMLNGINISNPQTGHHTFDLPLSPDDIERIEVVEGGASRVYGSSAFSGVINIVTKEEKDSNIGAHISGGSYGTFGANAHANLLSGNFANRISSGWMQTDGASANSDMRRGHIYWNERYSDHTLDLRMQASISNMKYGANTFYGTGSNSQYEENTRYIMSLQGEVKGRMHLLPQLYFTRTDDHYVWTRNNPSAYENYHQTTTGGATLNAWTQWALGKTALGIEYRRENILSTRLGKPLDADGLHRYPGYKYKDGRTNTGIYAEHDILLRHWSISAGLLASHNTRVADNLRFYPGIDISYIPSDHLRLFASFNQSLRTPTYTDLYYNGPGLEGNADLKNEKSTDYSIGMAYRNGLIHAQAKAFYRKGTDMIDWVKRPDENVWTTANSDIDHLGAEATATFDFASTLSTPYIYSLTLSYCYNHQERKGIDRGMTYANQLVYLRHKFVATMRHRILSHMSAQWEFAYKDRTGWFDNALTMQPHNYGSFGQLDLRLQYELPALTLYLQGNNLTNRKYYDIANVVQPGFWFTVGGKINIRL